MQKAHLYEAIFLFNHSMDEAVRGLERLKRAPDLDAATVDEQLAAYIAYVLAVSKREKRAIQSAQVCSGIHGVQGCLLRVQPERAARRFPCQDVAAECP
jgi:hypothetical protein